MYRAGQALAFGGLAASTMVKVARCDDDDDDEPLTPAQQAHADQIDALKKQAGNVSITPAMALCLLGGLAAPLGHFIAQGAGMPTTLGGMTLSIGVLWSLVGAATQTKPREVKALMAKAKDGQFPGLLFVTYGAGIVGPALSGIVLRTGNPLSFAVAAAASVATTGVIYAVIVSPMQNLAVQKAP